MNRTLGGELPALRSGRAIDGVDVSIGASDVYGPAATAGEEITRPPVLNFQTRVWRVGVAPA
jgi:hypothetical protein